MKTNALVVEDDSIWLDNIINWLEENNYFVYHAKSFTEAMNLLGKTDNYFELVVADIVLNKNKANNIEGLKILEYLIKKKRVKNSIVITGHPSDENEKSAKRFGAFYLVKGNNTYPNFHRILKEVKQKDMSINPIKPNLQNKLEQVKNGNSQIHSYDILKFA